MVVDPLGLGQVDPLVAEVAGGELVVEAGEAGDEGEAEETQEEPARGPVTPEPEEDATHEGGGGEDGEPGHRTV